jgi:peptide/nickel transport system permease protein
MALRDYIITRILLTIPMILILLSTVFIVMRVLPGNPVLLRFEKNADPALVASFTHQLGLDKPLYLQFFDYLWGLLHGDFGTSMAGSFEPVGPQILSRFPMTLELTIYAFVVAVVVGVLFGSFAARTGGRPDEAVKVFGILIYAFPVFFLGMILQLIFGVWLHVLPVSGRLEAGVVPTSPTIQFFLWTFRGTGLYTVDSLLSGNLREFVDAVRHLILPATALGLVISGIFVRMTRTNMMETMRADFVTAARARGLKESTVVYAYALRNAMLPIVTIMGLQFALLLSGAILTETEFSLLGLGTYLVDRINFRDYTAVQGTVVFLALLISSASLIVDILYAYLDPRVRL